jgi:hypothetical protein
MTKGLPRSLKNGPKEIKPIVRADISFVDTVLQVDGATGVGWGTVVAEGLPEGNILIVGAVLDVTIDEQGDAGISDTFNGDIGVGSTPADDGTITAGDVDIIPSTATPAAVAGVSTVRATSTPTESGTILDNTGGTLELNVNLLIDDADISADDIDLLVNGTLHLSYIVLGDD